MEIKPKIIVFAGPNGSGKSTITKNCTTTGIYINADVLQKTKNLTVENAAKTAEALREQCLLNKQDFTFETVLSTPRNLYLLQRAKNNGYFIRGYYVLTHSADINVLRVQSRVLAGGHPVPEEKIRTRYARALYLLPKFVEVCNVCSIYDNSTEQPIRIFKKKHNVHTITPTSLWNNNEIAQLVYHEVNIT